jgi:hypothetical protein
LRPDRPERRTGPSPRPRLPRGRNLSTDGQPQRAASITAIPYPSKSPSFVCRLVMTKTSAIQEPHEAGLVDPAQEVDSVCDSEIAGELPDRSPRVGPRS